MSGEEGVDVHDAVKRWNRNRMMGLFDQLRDTLVDARVVAQELLRLRAQADAM